MAVGFGFAPVTVVVLVVSPFAGRLVGLFAAIAGIAAAVGSGLDGYQSGYLVAGGLAVLAAVVALRTPGHVGRPGLTTPAERVRMDR